MQKVKARYQKCAVRKFLHVKMRFESPLYIAVCTEFVCYSGDKTSILNDLIII